LENEEEKPNQTAKEEWQQKNPRVGYQEELVERHKNLMKPTSLDAKESLQQMQVDCDCLVKLMPNEKK